MIKATSIEEAIISGHKSSTVLKELVDQVVEDFSCPEANGFEGPDTFGDCNQDTCTYCLCKKIKISEKHTSLKRSDNYNGSIYTSDRPVVPDVFENQRNVTLNHRKDW